MEQPTFLRPAKVGGFVKEDVLAFVDELNSKIYSLEEELKAAHEQPANMVDRAELQKYEDEIKTLRTDLGNANAGLRKAQEELAASSQSSAEAAQLAEEIKRLRAENDTLTATNAALQAENTGLQANSASNAQGDAALAAENAALQAEVMKLQGDVAAATALASLSDQNGAETAKLQEVIREKDAKLAEVEASLREKSDALAEQEKQTAAKDKEINKLQDEVAELKEASENDSAIPGGFDMGALFTEAQMTAKKITIEARNAADKLTKEAKEQAESIVNEANMQADRKIAEAEVVIETTIAEANDTAKMTIEDANMKAKTANEMSGTVRSMLRNEIDGVSKKLTEITELFAKMSSEADSRFGEAQDVIAEARNNVGDVPPDGPQFEMPNEATADTLKAKLKEAPPADAFAKVGSFDKKQKDAPAKQEQVPEQKKAPKKPDTFDFDDLAKTFGEAMKNGEGSKGSWV